MKASPQKNHTGKLTMASTSIGTLEDIPARTLTVLREADLVVFEEHRPARQMLKAAGVQREYVLFSEHRQQDTLEEIREKLKQGGSVVYASDQGCPTLADPGKTLIETAEKVGAQISVIPGPSALTGAIAACPFDCQQFWFAGFLDRNRERRQKQLQIGRTLNVPVIIFETPYRLQALLSSCAEVYEEQHDAFLACEIGQPTEQYVRGTFHHLLEVTKNWEKRNFVLIIR